jgi:hypothetical protein
METISLDPDSILAEAREKSGLADFGDESYHEAMLRMLRSLDREADLNATGRAVQRQRTVDILISRARTEDYFRRHPEIAGEQIGAPVVICGLPRTGTTMLHRVIANDPGFDAALWYECRFPAPFEGWRPDAPDARIAVAEQEVAATLAAMPELASVHPFDAKGPDEEIMLLEQSFFSRTPESYANIPSFSEWLDRQDQLPGYRYLYRLLQFLQWQHRQQGRARPRWVLKAPHHLSFMPLLFAVFPDAMVIQTHRDPMQSIPSICSMCFFLWKLGSDHADSRVAGRHWNAKWADALQRCLDYRDAGHEDRFIDVDYLDSVRDPIGVVRRIFGLLGRELTPVAEEKMRRWTEDNAREKRAPHEYTLEQFGLSEASIARDYRNYRERYILPAKSGPRRG